jgi:acetolactate synthase I/II/III large subunit
MTNEIDPAQMTGADVLVESLLAQGVSTVFALPGAQIDHLFCSFYDRPGQVRVVTSRHEQGAAYMAFGAARSTGKPSVYAIVPGPGWLNASAALATAYGCNAPVLCLSGQIPSSSIGLGIGELHELPDQLAMAKGVTKWAARANDPVAASALVAEAFQALQTGRPRPAHIEMSPDIMGLCTPAEISLPLPLQVVTPDPDQLARAIEALNHCTRPVIFVGSGAQGASQQITELSKRLGAAVIAMRSGRGVLDDRSPRSLPWFSGHELWQQADVVLAIGTRLDFQQRMWGVDDDLKIIRIDIDPEEPARINKPFVSLVADAALATQALLDGLDAKPPRITDSAFQAIKQQGLELLDKTIGPQMAFLRAIRAALPEDGFFVDELTQIGYAAWSWFPTYYPRHFISSGYQGTLGYGFPTALGVKVANPTKAVISVSGDGGFLFAGMELASAVQHKIATITIIFRDNKFGNVQRIQRERYAGKVIGSDLHNPDFVALAQSFGANALRCETPAQLQQAILDNLDHDGPTIIEVPVGDFPTPWNLIVRPKVRGT